MNRYMKCETITGEWWYKDLQTGEDLPKYATPIIGLEEEPEILTRWQDPTIEEYKKEIERLNNINKQLVEECQKLDDEETRLNNIISEALGIANERINYYYHNKNDELLKEWEEIFEKLVKRDNKLKGE